MRLPSAVSRLRAGEGKHGGERVLRFEVWPLPLALTTTFAEVVPCPTNTVLQNVMLTFRHGGYRWLVHAAGSAGVLEV